MQDTHDPQVTEYFLYRLRKQKQHNRGQQRT